MNSRLGESVSDIFRAKIRLGEFKAVYSFYKGIIFASLNPDKSFQVNSR